MLQDISSIVSVAKKKYDEICSWNHFINRTFRHQFFLIWF